jgi:hypothetical protein
MCNLYYINVNVKHFDTINKNIKIATTGASRPFLLHLSANNPFVFYKKIQIYNDTALRYTTLYHTTSHHITTHFYGLFTITTKSFKSVIIASRLHKFPKLSYMSMFSVTPKYLSSGVILQLDTFIFDTQNPFFSNCSTNVFIFFLIRKQLALDVLLFKTESKYV